jgi:hypothetical protein
MRSLLFLKLSRMRSMDCMRLLDALHRRLVGRGVRIERLRGIRIHALPVDESFLIADAVDRLQPKGSPVD